MFPQSVFSKLVQSVGNFVLCDKSSADENDSKLLWQVSNFYLIGQANGQNILGHAMCFQLYTLPTGHAWSKMSWETLHSACFFLLMLLLRHNVK